MMSMTHAQEDNASQFTDSNSNFSALITTNSFHEGLVCDGFDTVLLIQDNIPWDPLNLLLRLQLHYNLI